jgi:hypothetical protein
LFVCLFGNIALDKAVRRTINKHANKQQLARDTNTATAATTTKRLQQQQRDIILQNIE